MKKWTRVFESHFRRPSLSDRRHTVHDIIIPYLEKKTDESEIISSDTIVATEASSTVSVPIAKEDFHGLVQEVLLRALDVVDGGNGRQSQHLLARDLLKGYLLDKKKLVKNDLHAVSYLLDQLIKESQKRIQPNNKAASTTVSHAAVQLLALYMCYTLQSIHAHHHASATELPSTLHTLFDQCFTQLLKLLTLQFSVYYRGDMSYFIVKAKAARVYHRTIVHSMFSLKAGPITVEYFIDNIVSKHILQSTEEQGLVAGVAMQLLLSYPSMTQDTLQQLKEKVSIASPVHLLILCDKLPSLTTRTKPFTFAHVSLQHSEAMLKCFKDFVIKHSTDTLSITKTSRIVLGNTSVGSFMQFRPFVTSLLATDEQMKEVFQTLLTAYRRSRSWIAPLIAAFVAQMEKSESNNAIVRELIPCMLDCLSSKNAHERDCGAAMVSAFIQKMSGGVDVLKNIIQKLQDQIRRGGLGPVEKSASLHALQRLSQYDDLAENETAAMDDIVFNIVIPFLASLIEDRSEPERIRSEACTSASRFWIARRKSGSSIPDSLLKAIEKAAFQETASSISDRSSDYDIVRKFALRSLGDLVELDEGKFVEQVFAERSTIDHLVDIITKSDQRLVIRPTAVYALRVLMTAQTSNEKLQTTLFQQKKLLTKISHLMQVDATATRFVRGEDYEVLADVLKCLYVGHFTELYQKKTNELTRLLQQHQRSKKGSSTSSAVAPKMVNPDKTSAMFLLDSMNLAVSFVLCNTVSHKARRLMKEAVNQIIKSQSDPSIAQRELFINGFCDGMIPRLVETFHNEEQRIKSLAEKQADSDTFGDQESRSLDAARKAQRSIIGDAFIVLAPHFPQNQLDEFMTAVFPQILLHGHHPLIYDSRGSNAFMAYVKEQQLSDEIKNRLLKHLHVIIRSLLNDTLMSASKPNRESEADDQTLSVEIDEVQRQVGQAVGMSLASLIEVFVSTTSQRSKFVSEGEESKWTEDEQNKDAKNVAFRIFSLFDQMLHEHQEKLRVSFTDEDVDVYVHHYAQLGTNNAAVAHDIDLELTNNPLFRQTKEDDVDVTGHKYKYRLTNAEWQTVFRKEKDIKEKKKSKLDINTIRRQLVEKTLLKKERAQFLGMHQIYQNIWWLIDAIGSIFTHVYIRRRGHRVAHTLGHIVRSNMSYVVLHVADLFSLRADFVRTKSKEVFRSLSLSSRGYVNRSIVDLVLRCTYRIRAKKLDETRSDNDDDVVFARYVTSHLRREFMRKLIDPELFSLFVPFFESIINRDIQLIHSQGLSREKMDNSSLTQCLSVLSAHAGLDSLKSGTVRPRVAKILVEALSFFSTLYRQAFNALLSFGQYLLLEDLSPILDGLKNTQSNVRLACLQTLQMYAIMSDRESSAEENELAKIDALGENDARIDHLILMVWFAQFDEDEDNQEIAKSMWNKVESKIINRLTSDWKIKAIEQLLQFLSDGEEYVRETSAAALAALAANIRKKDAQIVSKLLEKLFALYDHAKTLAKELKSSYSDKPSVIGVANSIKKCSDIVTSKADLDTTFNFIVYKALWDNDSEIQEEMNRAGLAIIETQGLQNQEPLLKILRSMLENKAALISPHGHTAAASKQQFLTAKQQEDLRVALQEEQFQRDYVLASLVVFMGTLAKFFDSKNPILMEVVNQLMDTLHVQSNSVQKSVSKAMSPLIDKLYREPTQHMNVQKLIDRLMNNIMDKDATYGDRRGAAYGLAGIAGGLKLKAFQEYNVINRLYHAFKTQKDFTAKEGVLLAFEVMAARLQSKIEPYLPTHILPVVLEAIADTGRSHIRETAEQCSSVVMQESLTGHGVRMILPQILKTVRIDSAESSVAWRTKVAAIHVLGSMAYCAPRQLSESLPQVIPVLTDALHDTHPDVSKASRHALERVGGVCQNPEIAQQVPTLLDTLQSMDDKTKLHRALESLLYTRFLHSIDPASLSLLVPILLRGLRERTTLIKQNAAQIIGSMTALCSDSRDIVPYISDIIQPLKEILIDPQPNVRASAAKAVGSLARSIGENRLQDLVLWLFSNLEKQDTASSINDVERSGAAQGLCEMIAAQGVERLQEMLPLLLQKISPGEKPYIRQGYMEIFVYLPALMRSQFEPFLPDCLPRILDGLSDAGSDMVRETAVKSCKVIVELYASNATSIALLLPALLNGMEAPDYRQRYSSLQVLHDFLKRLSEQALSEKSAGGARRARRRAHKKDAAYSAGSHDAHEMDDDPVEDEGSLAEGEVQMIDLETLNNIVRSKELVDRLLCLLFMLQNDEHPNIRNMSSRLWRELVRRPAFILKMITKPLLQMVILHLSSKSEDLQYIAGKALGDLVSKLGERVMNDVIPTLDREIADPSASLSIRRGVSLGMRELLTNASERHVRSQQKKLLGFIKTAICDTDPEVRENAADSFDVLFKIVGTGVVNEIVQELLVDLNEMSLGGLQQLIAIRGQHFLPRLIPSILGTDEEFVSEDNLKVLAAVVQASSASVLAPYLAKLLQKLIMQMGATEGTASDHLYNTFKYTVQTVPQDEIYTLVEAFSSSMKANNPSLRRGACYGTEVFAKEYYNRGTNKDGTPVQRQLTEEQTDELVEKHIPELLESLLRLFLDPDVAVQKQSWGATRALLLPAPHSLLRSKDELPQFIAVIRESIQSLTEDANGNRIIEQLPALNNVPKGLDPLVDTFLQGLMFGKTTEIREQAALGLGDCIELSNEQMLKPYVIKLTGPLIRIAGDRFPWNVKSAIFRALSLLMEKGGMMLRPFLPQLQTIFIKTLQDTNNKIRMLAADGLGQLVQLLGPRIGVLVGELHNGLKAISQQKKLAQVFTDVQQQGIMQANLQACNRVLDSIISSPDNMKQIKSQNLQTLYVTLADILHQVSASPFTFDVESSEIRENVAMAVGACAVALSMDEDESFFMDSVMEQEFDISGTVAEKDDAFSTPLRTCARVLTFASMIKKTSGKIVDNKLFRPHWPLLKTKLIVTLLAEGADHAERVNMAAATAAKYLLINDPSDDNKDVIEAMKSAVEKAQPSEHQLRLCLVNVMKSVCRKSISTFHLFGWVDPLLSMTRDRYNPVRLGAEKALVSLLHLRYGTTVLDEYLEQASDQSSQQKTFRETMTKLASKYSKSEDSDSE